jgi:hypothetical protein
MFAEQNTSAEADRKRQARLRAGRKAHGRNRQANTLTSTGADRSGLPLLHPQVDAGVFVSRAVIVAECNQRTNF